MRAITLTTVLLVSAFNAEISLADANNGDLFGYELGDRYPTQQSDSQGGGKLLLIEARDPIKPRSIDKVYVLLTPVTYSIGRIAGETWYASGENAIVEYERYRVILRQKYGDWESEERTEQKLHMSRFSKGDHELIVQVSGPHSGNLAPSESHVFRFLLTLNYKSSTEKAVAFEAMAHKEIEQSGVGIFSQDDVQGL